MGRPQCPSLSRKYPQEKNEEIDKGQVSCDCIYIYTLSKIPSPAEEPSSTKRMASTSTANGLIGRMRNATVTLHDDNQSLATVLLIPLISPVFFFFSSSIDGIPVLFRAKTLPVPPRYDAFRWLRSVLFVRFKRTS